MHHTTPCQRGAVIRREDLTVGFSLFLKPLLETDGVHVIRSEAFLAFLDSNFTFSLHLYDIFCTYSYMMYAELYSTCLFFSKGQTTHSSFLSLSLLSFRFRIIGVFFLNYQSCCRVESTSRVLSIKIQVFPLLAVQFSPSRAPLIFRWTVTIQMFSMGS